MRRIAISLLLAFGLLTVVKGQKKNFSIDQIYPIDAGHSYVGFEIKYMGYAKVKGRFANFKGSLRYDPYNLSNTSVTLSVNVESIDTDLDFRDRDLKSANWFDAPTFPEITFSSTSAKENEYGLLVTGDLTIKNVTKTVSIQMDKGSGLLKDTRGDSQVVFTGELTINRKDFGVQGERWSRIKEGITSVADEVTIEVSILGKRFNEQNLKNFVRREETPPGKLYKIANEQGIEKALYAFDEMKGDASMQLNVNALNIGAYIFMRQGKIKEAAKLLAHNVKAFPDEANAHDSYGEALALLGNWKEAKAQYQRSLELNPGNQHAKEILKHL